MVWVGKYLKDHLIASPCHGQGHLSLDEVAQSSVLALDTSRDRASTASLATSPGSHHPHREELYASMLIPKSLMFGCTMNRLRNGKGEENPIQHLSLDTVPAISLPEVKYQKPAKTTASSHQHQACLLSRAWQSIIWSAVLWYLIKKLINFFINMKRVYNLQVYGGIQKTVSPCPVKKPSNQPVSKTPLIVSEVISRMKPGLFWLSVCQIPENKIPLPTRTVRQTKPKSRMHWNFSALTCIKTKFLLPVIVSQKAQLKHNYHWSHSYTGHLAQWPGIFNFLLICWSKTELMCWMESGW